MTTDPVQSDVFKFVALRPPDAVDRARRKVNFIADNRKPENTPAGELVKRLSTLEDHAQAPARIKEFIQVHEYTDTLLQDDPILVRIDEFLRRQAEAPRPNAGLIGGIEQILDGSIAEYYESDETQDQVHTTWDGYFGLYLMSRVEPQNLEHLTHTLRLFHVVQLLVEGVDLSDRQSFSSAMSAMPLVPKLFTNLPRPGPKPPAPVAGPSPEKVAEYRQIWADLVDTNRALDEVKNLRYEVNTIAETRKATIPNRETGIATETRVGVFKNTLAISPVSFGRLHASTRRLLEDFGADEHSFQLADTLGKIQNRVTLAHQAIAGVDDPRFLEFAPAEAKQIPGFAAIKEKFDLGTVFLPRPATNIRSSIKPLGVGDLKVVKQKLVKYAAGEVAHIENVLRGEHKERRHRVLDRTEEVLVALTETEEETTRDTQSTERFELKKESENTLQEQMSVQAGVTVTGSYGAVTFGAHGDFAYSTASQDSNKTSTNFAKEVIDRSVSRIQKKTREERTTKKLHEVEELNTHGIDNRGQPDHVTGIYRWVDKYYQAQIYNYGKRMMFEFIIPEPAAFYTYALANPPRKEIALPKPFTAKFMDITEHNYMDFMAEYNVQGVTPPPIPWKTVSTSLSKDGMELAAYKSHVLATHELLVPEGYYSSKGVWFDCSAYFSNAPRLEITIGNKLFRLLDNNGSVGAVANNANKAEIAFATFSGGNPIQISVNSYDVISYTINAYVFVERNWETYQQWQIRTWEKIASTYQVLKDDYDQKAAAAQTRAGVAIQGQNPRINREIEKTELKKNCAKLLMDVSQFGSFDAMKQPKPGTPPDFDIFDALAEGRIVQFFEQAFEWENITYLFYPYFWGRYNEWARKLNVSDTDPLFGKFLQAGSARVVVPVHPAYNDAVMYFLENNGALWRGGDTPRLNDPMFISIAEELRNQTDDLAGAKPEGDPWEVVVPTTLVYLQEDGVLPVLVADA
jgi:hypothetical protein